MGVDPSARGLAARAGTAAGIAAAGGALEIDSSSQNYKRSRALRKFWYDLSNRETAPVNVWFVGDSITEGYPPAGVAANLSFDQSWRTLLLGKLRTRYATSSALGTGGYYSAYHVLTNPIGYPVTITGSTTGSAAGPGLRYVTLSNVAHNVTFTAPANTTAVDVFWAGNASTGTFSWKVNAGATTNVNTVLGSLQDATATRITCTAGDVITITYVSGVLVWIDGFFAYGGDETKGIRAWDSGHAGGSAFQFNNSFGSGSFSTQWYRFFNTQKPSLVFIGFGANDAKAANGNRTSAQFRTDVNAIVSNLRTQAGAGNWPSIALWKEWQVDADASLVEPWQNYMSVLDGIAAGDNDIWCVNMANVIAKTVPFAAGDSAGGFLPDYTHPGVAGSEVMADAFFNLIVPS